MLRVIVDTNVFVSGIFWSGPPGKIVEAWHEGLLQLVTSVEILDEYGRVAIELGKQYPQIDLAAIIELVTMNSHIYKPMAMSEAVCRDSDDDKFIACALESGCNIIVSGDKDLLSLGVYQTVEIITPALFVKQYLSPVLELVE